MKFDVKHYEVCPKCHNIKQCDDFTVMEVQPNELRIENKCYTCDHVELRYYRKVFGV